MLEVDAADESTWADARRAMKVMLAEQDRWDRDMRTSAAREKAHRTRVRVARVRRRGGPRNYGRELRSPDRAGIAMDADGSFSAYFDDDDMFFGHCVTAYGTLTDGVTAANMEGERWLSALSVFVCGDRKLKGQTFGMLAKVPASSGILFHEFRPQAPRSVGSLRVHRSLTLR